MSVDQVTEKQPRRPYLLLMCGSLVVLLGIAALWLAQESSQPWLVDALLPWLVDALLPWQAERLRLYLQLAGYRFLFLALLAALSALLTFDHLPPSRTLASSRRAILLPIALALVFATAYGAMVVIRHLRFNWTAYELAIHEQTIWSTLHGYPFATSLEMTAISPTTSAPCWSFR